MDATAENRGTLLLTMAHTAGSIPMSSFQCRYLTIAVLFVSAPLCGQHWLQSQNSDSALAAPRMCTAAKTGLPALSGTLPARPRSCYAPPYPTTSTSTTVSTTVALQSALTAAACGQQIVVTANTVYEPSRGLSIPATVCPKTKPILVVSSAISSIAQYVPPSQAAASWSGTAQGGSIGTITLDIDASSTDSVYNGRTLAITGGTGSGQVGTVSSYIGSTNVATMTANWTTAPDNTSIFVVGSLLAPTIACTGSGCGAMGIADKASGWYFAGIDFTVDPSVTGTYPVVAMGDNTTTVAALPRYIAFDRCWVHPSGTLNVNSASRGIDLNAVYGTVMYSNIWGFVSTTKDTQAILTVNTTGPLLITGNHLEATGENLALFTNCASGTFEPGDGIPTCPPPSDVTITRNYIKKLTSWYGGPSGCVLGGSPACYVVKNSWECKSCRRVLTDSNIFDTTFSQGQPEFIIDNCGFSGTAFVCSDLTYTNNLFMHGPAVAVMQGNGTTNTGQRILFRNDLAIDINGELSPAGWGGVNAWGESFQIGGATNNVTIDHVTVVNTPTTYLIGLMFEDGDPSTDLNFRYTNSFSYASPASAGNTPGGTVAALPTPTVGKSVFVGDFWPCYTYGCILTPPYPVGIYTVSSTATPVSGQPPCNDENKPIAQCWPLDWALVGFVDFTGGNAGTDLAGMALSSTSAWHNAGTDGHDVGANVAAVLAAVSGVQ